MSGALAFATHSVAAALFAALILWRLRSGVRLPAQQLMLAGFTLTACWAWLGAIAPESAVTQLAETFRNFTWLALLHSLSGGAEAVERQRGVRLVYGAVGAVLGLQMVADLLPLVAEIEPTLAATAILLRITAAAGLLVLVHNLYGQADPASRSGIAMAMLALVASWGYDLNLYTLAYLDPVSSVGLADWRGVLVALTAPLFAIGAGRADGWRIRLSRAATFQSLSLLAICAYFAMMTILATALRGSGFDWSRPILIAMLAAMTVAAMVLLPNHRARGWAKVKLAKHLFEHRYDYRTEWLRFADTIGRSGSDVAPLGERLVKAFADILDSSGGLLLVVDEQGQIEQAAVWNWDGAGFAPDGLDRKRWAELERDPRILDFGALRRGDQRGGSALPVPPWLDDDSAWCGVPLIHGGRLIGLVILFSPDFRRALDWEDFDLLKTAGRQAASSLAEAHGQQALAQAQRFDEFNRRFAFILHDIKNLVSQLSLVARNAERHADNPEFRTDMIATLRSSVGKMTDLLARLTPASDQRPAKLKPTPLRPLVAALVAARRASHDVTLSGDGNHWVLADPLLLEQAIAHLLQNALDASAPSQGVTVRMGGDGDEVTISIIDQGPGMDSDFIRTRLFQPFASTKDGGFGVGAFEARSLIAAMGGRLSVDSRPGQGSRFTIYLPESQGLAEPKRKRA
ncbi:MAG: PEP-CTERM system histidine kinase PrsK [Sphingomonas bacterium]|nr:PEP-CTERM system histidine kinase PrsK [Sphingomonas bacterium]